MRTHLQLRKAVNSKKPVQRQFFCNFVLPGMKLAWFLRMVCDIYNFQSFSASASKSSRFNVSV